MLNSKLDMDKIREYYHNTSNIEELANNIKKDISVIHPDLKIGYVDLFNLTIKQIKYLTFPQYMRSHKYRFNLHTYQALSAYLFTECDFDYVLIIQGLEGIGKSTYALKVIDELKKLGKNYNQKDHMITKSWEFNDVMDLMKDTKNSVVYFDEAKKFLDLRRSMYPERIDLLEYFTTERWRRNIYIMCASDMTEIDKYFRERRAKAITMLPDRGLAYMLHSINLFGIGQDRFHLERFEQQISTNLGSASFERQLAMLMNLPSCNGIGFTSKMEGEAWNEYFNLKIEEQVKTGEKEVKKVKGLEGVPNLSSFE